MPHASIRSSGPKMVPTSTAKHKIFELLPGGQSVDGNWETAWATYSSSDLDARVSRAKSYGATGVKLSSSGLVSSGSPPPALMEEIIQDFCDILRKYGMFYYASLVGPSDFMGSAGDAATRNVNVSLIAAHFALWWKHGQERIIGVDVCNEVNFGRPSTWPSDGVSVNAAMTADLAYFLAAIRAVAPGLPTTFSVYMTSASAFAGNQMLALHQTLNCPFHDYHPYNGHNNHSTGLAATDAPGAFDPSLLEAQPYYVGRHFIGECGIINTNTDAAVVGWIQGMAAQAARPQSHGGVYFGDENYTSSAENGNYGLTGAAPIAAYTAWPTSDV